LVVLRVASGRARAGRHRGPVGACHVDDYCVPARTTARCGAADPLSRLDHVCRGAELGRLAAESGVAGMTVPWTARRPGTTCRALTNKKYAMMPNVAIAMPAIAPIQNPRAPSGAAKPSSRAPVAVSAIA